MEGDLQLFIYRVADEQAYALSKVLASNGLEYDWDGPYAEVGTVAVAMKPYTQRPSACLDAPRDLADQIIEAAPDTWFQVWTHPEDGALGTLVQYVPDLGKFEAMCDASGQPFFTAREMLEAAAVGDTGAKVITGYAWEQKLSGSGEERVITAADPEAGEEEQFFGPHSDAVDIAKHRDQQRALDAAAQSVKITRGHDHEQV